MDYCSPCSNGEVLEEDQGGAAEVGREAGKMNEMNEKLEEPQEQPSDRAPMPDEELQKILAAHRKWVESEGKEGKKADLVRANLRVAYLFDANLQEAFLTEANLQGANLSLANLQGANLSLANLQGANLFDANLQGANLRAARLRGADLGGAKGLIASQVNIAKNWELAFYSLGLVFELELPRDHNERLKKKLAEMEKEKKASSQFVAFLT